MGCLFELNEQVKLNRWLDEPLGRTSNSTGREVVVIANCDLLVKRKAEMLFWCFGESYSRLYLLVVEYASSRDFRC